MTWSEERIGIFNDAGYQRDEDGSATTVEAFVLFCCAVGESFAEYVLIGRCEMGGIPRAVRLPESARIVPLPDYPSLRDLASVARALPATLRASWRAVGDVDRLWVLGPNPIGLILIAVAAARRRPVVLGIRQDTRQYFASRRPKGPARIPHAIAAAVLDGSYRLLNRVYPLTTVGPAAVGGYPDRASRQVMAILLIEAGDVAAVPRAAPIAPPIELLSVGRLDVEKNPFLLVDLIAELDRREPGRHHLTIIGTGPMAQAIADRRDMLGLTAAIDLPGYVPIGSELLAHYHQADLFVHVSHTEGVPQVIAEALATATPVVATDVGSVRWLLADGAAGLLMPPGDLPALVAAVDQALADDEGRRARVEAGLARVRPLALRENAATVAAFVGGAERAGAAGSDRL